MGKAPQVRKQNPLAVRLPDDDLAWLRARRERASVSVNSMIVKAVQQYRNRVQAAEGRRSRVHDAD